MSTLVLSQHRFQPKALQVKPSFRFPYQLRLPFDGRRVVGVVLRLVKAITRKRPVTRAGVVFFGDRHQFVAIGSEIRRVG